MQLVHGPFWGEKVCLPWVTSSKLLTLPCSSLPRCPFFSSETSCREARTASTGTLIYSGSNWKTQSSTGIKPQVCFLWTPNVLTTKKARSTKGDRLCYYWVRLVLAVPATFDLRWLDRSGHPCLACPQQPVSVYPCPSPFPCSKVWGRLNGHLGE